MAVASRGCAHDSRLRGGDKASRKGPKSSELASIGVDPQVSKRGIGGLVAAFLAESKRRGADEVYLTTDAEGNERVNVFYERLGFMPRPPIRGGRRTEDERVFAIAVRRGFR